MSRSMRRLYDVAFGVLLLIACDPSPKAVVSRPLLSMAAAPAKAVRLTLQPGESLTVLAARVAPDTIPGPVVHDTVCGLGWTCTPPKPPKDSTPVVVPPKDTTPPVIVPPVATGGTIGFGLYSMPDLNAPGAFTAAHLDELPSHVVADIAKARAHHLRLVLALTGGGHANYMSVQGGVNKFDRTKWSKKLQTYNTPAIRKAIADGVADGTVVAANIMDEPHVAGAGDGAGSGDGNTWGPKGTMTKARVDSLCGEMHAVFPTLPAGPSHQWQVFEPTKRYRVCDLFISQYSARNDKTYKSVTAWRDSALAIGKRDHHQIMFSMNILNGGTQDTDGTWDCKAQGGVKGQNAPNCAPTLAQVKAWSLALGPFSCGVLIAWRYDQTSAKRLSPAFASVSDSLGKIPRKSCKR